jgi:hypothetical protein
LSIAGRRAALGVAILVAAGVGLLVASAGERAPNPIATRVVTSRNVAFRVPRSWQAVIPAPVLPGVSLSDPVARAAPDRQGATNVLAGLSDGEGPTLLSAGLRSRLEQPAHGRGVRLGALEALRYSGVRVRGLPELTLYAVPTAKGVVTLACFTPRPKAVADRSACEAAALTLTLRRASALPLDPSHDEADQLNSIFARLTRATRRSFNAMAGASTPRRQASAAGSLARAYADARRSVNAGNENPALRPTLSQAS